MMYSTAPPFFLTHEQAYRLHAYIQTYRQYALTSLPPSPGRNTALRLLQGLEGKLIELLDQPTTPLRLCATREELATLKLSISDLFALYAKQPESQERIATLADLTALKSSLNAYV